MIEIRIEGPPRVKTQRRLVPGRTVKKRDGTTTTTRARLVPDPKGVAYEQRVARLAAAFVNTGGWATSVGDAGPVDVGVSVVLKRPKRLNGRGDTRIVAPVRPDCDNIAKAVLDGLQRCCICVETQKRCRCASGQPTPFLSDDSRVVRLGVWKHYAGRDMSGEWEAPHVLVRVRRTLGPVLVAP